MESTLLPNIVVFLQNLSPFQQLPNETLENIASDIDILYLGKGDKLTNDDSHLRHLYIVRTGSVEQRFPDGGLRSRLGESDLFGFSLNTEDDTPAYQTIALQNTLLYRLDYSALLDDASDYPEVTEQLALNANMRMQSSLHVQWNQTDKGLFFEPIAKVASSRIAIATPQMTIQQVAHLMRHQLNCTCAVIVENDQLLGMITDKDMTKRVVAEAIDVTLPITQVMTHQPWTVSQDELVLTAVGIMMQHNIQNLPVVNEQHQVVGLITPQQLVLQHSVQAIFLIEKISRAESISELVPLALERQAVFEAMAHANLPAKLIGRVLSMIYDAFTRQIIKFAEQALGSAPCEYAWLAAGSHAREEVHLGSDQDNALLLDNCATESDRAYFSHFAMYVCKGLDECGYAICSGRFMAATPKWCQTQHVWQQYYRKWASNPEYDLLLNLTVFMDIRRVSGSEVLFRQLDEFRLEQVNGNGKLMSALVRNTLRTRPPLGIFNNLVLEKDGKNEKRLNIKKAAVNCLVDLARIYALNEGARSLNTEERFHDAWQQGVVNEHSYQDLIGTYHFVNQLRYRHHLECLRKGEAISNYLLPDHFSSFDRQHLKDAFRIISGFQDAIKMKFGG